MSYNVVSIEEMDRQIAVAVACVLAPFPYKVFSGAEKLELGDKRVVAMCGSQAQAEALIAVLWPGFGYWEREGEEGKG